MSQNDCALSLKMFNFCKNVNCPTSQDLLAFQNGELLAAQNETICKHLSDCEFCATEIEFYAHFPQADEECAETEIPAALYELAEAILSDKQKNFSLLNKLLATESIKI